VVNGCEIKPVGLASSDYGCIRDIGSRTVIENRTGRRPWQA
jgi:hypothetical protein